MHIKLVKSGEDIKKVSSLAEETFGTYYVPINGEEATKYMLKKFLSVKAIKKGIKEGYVYYLINDENDDIGFLSVRYRPAFLYLSKVYLKDSERGKGHFRVIFNMIKYLCRKENYSSVRLNVNKHNENSIAIYEHLGFRKFKDEVIDIGNGFVMDDYVYEYKTR